MRFSWALLFLATAATAHAEWTIASAQSEAGSAGLVHRHVVLENAADGGHVTFEFAIFSAKSCALRIIDNPEGERLASMMKREKYVCGVNGGYFDEQFKPIGLRIVNSQMLMPLKSARLITGVLFASPHGVQIVRAREFSQRQKIEAAIQCGPFLVDRSQRVGGLNNSQQARRTFAATAMNERALLGFCSEVSLADLAAILATTQIAADLKIQRALNLDGGSSSAFWFARENGSAFSIPEQKSVRDFVAVVPK
ncbi:MAG: phosphodiester glycosidase family protein [Candidatus Udaeobacter sp.]